MKINPLEKKMLDAVSAFYDENGEEFKMRILTKKGYKIMLNIEETDFITQS